jgi:microcystin-dependent protein
MARDNYTDVFTKRTVIAGTGTAMDGVPLLEPLQNIQITVYAVDAAGVRAGAPANIFTARTGAAAQVNPFVTDATGRVSFFADPGDYDIVVHDLNAPARIGDQTIAWSAMPGQTSGVPRTFLPDQGRGLADPGDLKLSAVIAEPAGWLFCDGRVLARVDYAALYAAIGTSYNIGGESGAQFRIPDYRDRLPVGVNNMGTQGDANRIPDPLLANGLGKTGGAAEVTLTGAQSGVASHSHGINDPMHEHYIHVFEPQFTGSGDQWSYGNQSFMADTGEAVNRASGGSDPAATGITINNANAAAAAEAHSNLPPVQRCNVLIKT